MATATPAVPTAQPVAAPGYRDSRRGIVVMAVLLALVIT